MHFRRRQCAVIDSYLVQRAVEMGIANGPATQVHILCRVALGRGYGIRQHSVAEYTVDIYIQRLSRGIVNARDVMPRPGCERYRRSARGGAVVLIGNDDLEMIRAAVFPQGPA